MNHEEHLDIPIEPQDKQVLLDDVDLGMGEDQPHNAMRGSQNHNTFKFSFHTDQTYSPALEPGLSHVLCYCEVFNVMPQSESKSEEQTEQDEGTHKDEDTYIQSQPDAAPKSEDVKDDNEIHAVCFEDLRVACGEETYQLDIQRNLDNLGSSILSVVAEDNIKAMALKIRNQLTQNVFKGI